MEKVKTANQLWRESGRRIPFKDFLEEHKKKAEYLAADGLDTFMLNKPINDSIQKTLFEMQQKGAGTKPGLTKDYILGVPKPWFWGGVAVVAVSVGLYVWYKKKG